MGPRVVLARTPRYVARLRPTLCVLRPPAVVRIVARLVTFVRRLAELAVPVPRPVAVTVGSPRGPPGND